MKRYLLYIKISVFLVFLGRAYQFYFFGGPFRAILWDESFLSPLVENIFKISWQDYATSKLVNYYIDVFTKICAFIFLIGAIISLFWEYVVNIKIKKTSIGIGVFLLVLTGVCLVKEKNYDSLQFFELSIQIAAPIALIFSNTLNKIRVVFWLRISIILTFVSHGVFATGLIYVPGNYIDMTIDVLGVTETVAKQLLFIVGILDLLSAIFIFIPKISKLAFIYIIVWGLLTAIARTFVGFNSNFFLSSLHNVSFLTIYRLPHGVIPLATYILYNATIANKKIIK